MQCTILILALSLGALAVETRLASLARKAAQVNARAHAHAHAKVDEIIRQALNRTARAYFANPLHDATQKHKQQQQQRPKTGRKRAATFETEMRGANYNLKYCEGAHDMEALIKDVLPAPDNIRPYVNIDVDEPRSRLKFAVEVPYVPFDSRWTIAFHPLSRDANQRAQQIAFPSPCSLLYEGLDNSDRSSSSSSSSSSDEDRSSSSRWHHQSDVESSSSSTDSAKISVTDRRGWEHAPNAKYRNAFSSPIDYPANYVPPTSAWSAAPKGCSHIVYTAEFSVEQLISCRDPAAELHSAGLLAMADDAVRALTSSLYVTLSLPNDANYAEYRFDSTLSVDRHESKVLLVDEARTSLPIHTQLRKVYVDDDDKRLQIVLQTVLHGDASANLTLISISAADHSSSFQLTSSLYEPAYHYERDIYLQNWYLSSTVDSDVFEGRFSLLFAERDDIDRHHATHMSLYVANPLPVDFSHQPLHSEITQHNDTFADQRQHIGAFDDGNRACMQTYIIGSERLSRLVQLSLVEAWLCTASEDEIVMAEDASELRCAERPHSAKLFDVADGARLADYNVTVHQPGAYGALSVAVCFNTNSAFRDEHNMTLTHANQRYESRVALNPARNRRWYALTDDAGSMYSQMRARSETLQQISALQVRRVDLLDAQSAQSAAFTPFKFQKSLDEARRLGLTTETHAHVFRVARAGLDNPISASEATAIVFTMLVAGACVFCCFVGFAWYFSSKKTYVSNRTRLDEHWRNNAHVVNHK